MYEKSHQYCSFAVAGFSHHEGYRVMDEIKPGARLRIVPEFDNPYDPDALALYVGQKTHIGYVPHKLNHDLAKFFYYGHGDMFSCFVTQVDPVAGLEGMVHATIEISDHRKRHGSKKHHHGDKQ